MSGWRHSECVQRIERVFSHAHRVPFWCASKLPLRDGSSPKRHRASFSGRMPPSLREVRRKEKEKLHGEKKSEGKKVRQRWKRRGKKLREEKKTSCKVESRVEAPSWGAMLLTDFSLIHRFLSYMAVCLTNLMVFFPLPESWMAVTPATLAIFWSQYGNGNRQP